MNDTNTGKVTNADVIAFYTSLVTLSGVYTYNPYPSNEAYLRVALSGEKVPSESNNGKTLAMYGSLAPDTDIINPLAEGEATGAANTEFLRLMSLSMSAFYLKVATALIQYAVRCHKTAHTAVSAGDKNKLTKKGNAAKAKNKDDTATPETVTEAQLMEAFAADEKIGSLSDADKLLVAETLKGLISRINSTTMQEFTKVGVNTGIENFISIMYNKKTREGKVVCRVFNESQRKSYSGIRVGSWEVFTTLMERILGVQDLAELTYKPKMVGAPMFESYVNLYVSLYERIAKFLPVVGKSADNDALDMVKRYLEYLPDMYAISRWAVSNASPVKQTKPASQMPLGSIPVQQQTVNNAGNLPYGLKPVNSGVSVLNRNTGVLPSSLRPVVSSQQVNNNYGMGFVGGGMFSTVMRNTSLGGGGSMTSMISAFAGTGTGVPQNRSSAAGNCSDVNADNPFARS